MTRALIFKSKEKVARCTEEVRNHLFFSEEQNYKPPFHLPTGLVVIFDLRKLQGVLCTRYLLEGKKGAKNLIISDSYLPSTYYAISDCHFFCKVENRGE